MRLRRFALGKIRAHFIRPIAGNVAGVDTLDMPEDTDASRFGPRPPGLVLTDSVGFVTNPAVIALQDTFRLGVPRSGVDRYNRAATADLCGETPSMFAGNSHARKGAFKRRAVKGIVKFGIGSEMALARPEIAAALFSHCFMAHLSIRPGVFS